MDTGKYTVENKDYARKTKKLAPSIKGWLCRTEEAEVPLFSCTGIFSQEIVRLMYAFLCSSLIYGNIKDAAFFFHQ